MPVKSTQRAVIDQAYSQAMRVLRGHEEQDIKKLMGAFQRAQSEILSKIHQQIMSEGWTLDTMTRTGRLQAMLDSITQVLQSLKAEQNGIIEQASIKQFAGAYQRTVYAMDMATPPTIAVAYTPPPLDAVKILANSPYKGAMFSQRVGIITDAMASDIRDELMQSMIQGEGMDAAALRVRGVLGVDDINNPMAYAARARTIARTEIMRAQNDARDFTYAQNSDIVDDTDWVVAPDDKTCRWCLRREGMTDSEIEAADPGDDPWGASTDCPLHPHCRCTKAPRLKSWKDLLGLDMPENLADDFRGMRNEDGQWVIQPVSTFNAWLDDRQLANALSDEFSLN